MCHDLSFSATTVEFISDILPNAVWDGQISVDFSTTEHVLSMSNRKCLVIYNRDGQLYKNIFEWGMIADFMDTPEKVKQYRIQMANARSEKVFDKKSAWYRVRNQRCLIAVDGFYEHREIKGWKNKVPYFIKLQNRSQLFLLGFYNYSPIPDVETGEMKGTFTPKNKLMCDTEDVETGEMKGTFTIITRPANDLMCLIHNHGPNKHRMPVLHQPEVAVKWLDNDLAEEGMKEMLDYQLPSEELEVWPVYSIRTTKPRPDYKSKTELFHWENLPPLGNDEQLAKPTLF